MPESLDPFRRRIDRAKFIIDALNRDVLDHFSHVHPHRIFLERDDEGKSKGEANFKVMVEPPDELPVHWPLVVGECIHEIRSALDNLIWFLAESHSGPAPWPIVPPWRSVQFPVTQSAGEFAKRISNWAHLLHSDDLAIIEQTQPYGGNDPHHLIHIAELSNADKHRAVHLLAIYNTGLANPPFSVTQQNDIEVISTEVTQNLGVCSGKTELGRMTCRVTGPKPNMKVQEAFRFEVSVDHPSIVHMSVIEMLMWMQIHTRIIIDLFAVRYP
jgi:hypothetical protein